MDQNVTIKDIARLAGVSITTVSRVINNKQEGVGEETVKRIRKIIEELNYQPNVVARSMITKRSHTIGLILPDIRNPFFSDLAKGVEDVCNKYAFGCFLCNTDGEQAKEDKYVQLLKGRVADGILFTTQNIEESNEVFLEFQRTGFPFCFIERYIDDMPDVPGVYFDNFNGAMLLTEHLLDLGHRKIAFITGPLATHNARQRRDGYLAALKDRGIAGDEALIVQGNYKFDGGYAGVSELMDIRGKSFTALFASNDLMALGALQNLESRGLKVPDDISVAGIDHIVYPPVLKPTVTTIEIPAYRMGVAAAELLFSFMQKKPVEEKKIMFAPQLFDQGSVRDLR
jgi:LacI family transcriptional regulator